MAKWKIYTPEGVQDILFEECFIKKNIEEKVRRLFRTYGYFEIETPTLEFFDVFSADADSMPQETMFKFFDQQGRILVLRPDTTIPVARVAATKYRDTAFPMRVSYVNNSFRYNELGGGRQKEFTQAGVEVLGAGGAEADAEVIATAVNAVRAAGIENFQIDIGQVEFFKGLMEETGLSAQQTEQIRILIDRKDFLGLEEIVNTHKLKDGLKEIIFNLPGLFGSIDVIDRLEKANLNKRSLAALANLRQVLEVLEDYGVSKYVSVDLGMVQSINYYTGIIFKGFTYGIGFPIISGGRYDKLMEKFGVDCPATGFSMGVNMIMMALERQKIAMEKPNVDSLVCYNKKGRKTAFKLCEELRKQGLTIEVDITDRGVDTLKAYAQSKGIGGIVHIVDDNDIEIHNLETGEVKQTSVEELLES